MIDGGGTHPVMIVNPCAVLEIQDLTIASGHTSFGGGRIENSGTLTVTNSTFSGNSASILGGGIANFLKLTVTNRPSSATAVGNGITKPHHGVHATRHR